MNVRAYRSSLTILLGIAIGLTCSGCKEDDPGFKTVTVSGTVEKIDLANSRVEITFYSDKHRKTVITEVVVTPETEIFINGELAQLADVKLGERAEGEAVVTREGDEQINTVTRVQIERPTSVTPRQPVPTEPETPHPSPGDS